MVSRLHDPHGILSHDHVNILFAGSVRIEDFEGWDIKKRLICFADGKQTIDHLQYYKKLQSMFLLFDSGAFSAWSKGEQIDIDEYVQTIIEHENIINAAENLDVIPGSKGNRQISHEQNITAASSGWLNYIYILSKLRHLDRDDLCSRIMPIHHQGESIDTLKMMIDYGCKYVGVSPSNDARTSQRMKYLDEVYNYLGSLPERILTHGYAVTSESLMKAYNWFTVDSISWIYSAGFGTIKTPFGNFCVSEDPRSLKIKDNLRIVVDSEGNIQFGNATYNKQKQDIIEYVKNRLMMDFSELSQDYFYRALANILYFKDFEVSCSGVGRDYHNMRIT